MKILLSLLILLSASLSFANPELSEDLVKEDVAISPILEGTVSIEEKVDPCPAGQICPTVQPGHDVTVQVVLNSCVDRLVSYYSVDMSSANGTNIYLTALNVHNEKAPETLCIGTATETINIDVASSMLPIKVHFVGESKGK